MSKRKLLLADDSITIQKVVNLTFADEGIEVISVGDGDSAMRKFDDFIPDLVMADVNMPGLNGYEMCQIIKNNEETQNIPVILLVGSFEPFDEAEAKRVGADDYLTKPFQSIRQLVNKVTDLLNRETNGAASAAPEASPAATADAPAPFEAAAEPEAFSASAAPVSFADAGYNQPPATETPAADSFAETWRMPEQPASDYRSDFGDAGMDDEMIETTRAADYDEAPPGEYRSGTETPEDYAQTQPLSAEDVRHFDFAADRAFDALPTETTPHEAADHQAEAFSAAPENEPAAPVFDEAQAAHSAPPESPDETRAAESAAPADENDAHPNDLIEQSYSAAAREAEDNYSSPGGEAHWETQSAAEAHGPAEEAPFVYSSEEATSETQDAQTEAQAEEPATSETEPEAEYQSTASYEYQRFSQEEPAAPSFDEAPPGEATNAAPSDEAETPASFDAETVPADQSSEAASPEIVERNAPEAFAADEPPPAAPAETWSAPPAAELRQSEIPTAERIAVVSFDDDDMLELPPLVEETGIRPAPKVEPEPAAVEEAPPPPPPAPTLSPEIIEAIAQRVAEKISGQAIQQIASQLAPQVSDLIVQELAREQEEKK